MTQTLGNGFRLALQTIRSHKLRAFLTVLGVIVGTGTIIGVGAILTGFDKNITSILASFGTNSIIVFKFNVGFRVQELTAEERNRKNLTYDNAVHIKERCRAVQDVSPMLFPNRGFINAKYQGNEMYDVDLFGVEEAYARGGQVELRVGRFFSDEESRRRAPVVVIGADIEKGLFANLDPVGKTILLDGHALTVVGTMVRPAASFFGDQDNRVLVPYWLMHKMYPNAKENAIVVTAREGRLSEAIDEVRAVLRIDRRVKWDKPDDFALSTAEQMIGDFRQITAITFLVMVVLSSVGLLVGGIGVMNIMLVSVTERTREIGLRKAVGARYSDLMMPFLIESVFLSLTGGMMGVLLGALFAFVAGKAVPSLGLAITFPAVALATGVSTFIGVFFGLYPASRAAALDPIEALRYE